MDGFTVTVVQFDGVSRVALAGEIDISTCQLLNKELEAARGRVLVDCQGVTFIDSNGIAELILLANRVESLTLFKPSAVLRRVIGALGLSEFLRIEDDLCT